MTNMEIKEALLEYPEHPFDKLPDWLQQELKVRTLSFGPRKPTPQEMDEAELDFLELRERAPETVADLARLYGIDTEDSDV